MAENLELFGLSVNQTRILFSIDKYLVETDIEKSKADKKMLKREWLRVWESSILDYLKRLDEKVDSLYGLYDIHEQVKAEKEKTNLLSWYYMIVLETSVFAAYTPLDKDIKKYRGLKYGNQIETVKNLIAVDGYIESKYVEEIRSEYVQNTKKLQGKGNKTIVAIFSAIAVAAAAAALCAAFAGPIAVALVGGQFTGLYGAALTSASLALLGGGALAAGGAGMAGGAAVIVGGGAILGMAAGGATGGVLSNALLSSPEYIISECAKFKTVIKRVLVEYIGDVPQAKRILDEYSKEITKLETELDSLQNNKEQKADLKKIKQSLKYMKTTYEDCVALVENTK